MTSQLRGSHESPQTTNVACVFFVSQNAIRSWHRSSSSNKCSAAIRMSRIRGNGKKSSHGWCGILRWMSVGRRLAGIVSILKVGVTGEYRLKMDIVSSQQVQSAVMPMARMLVCMALCTFNRVRLTRWSICGEPVR